MSNTPNIPEKTHSSDEISHQLKEVTLTDNKLVVSKPREEQLVEGHSNVAVVQQSLEHQLDDTKHELRRTNEKLFAVQKQLEAVESDRHKKEILTEQLKSELQKQKAINMHLMDDTSEIRSLLDKKEQQVQHLLQWKDAVQGGLVQGNEITNLSVKIVPKEFVTVTQKEKIPDTIKLEPATQMKIAKTFATATDAQRETLELVATFRQVTGQQASLEEKRFIGNPAEPETAVVVLRDVLKAVGAQLSFLPEGSFDSVEEAMANGIADFGAVHMLLDQDAHAQFSIKVLQDYNSITATPQTMQDFVNEFEHEISQALGINKQHIKVQELGRGSVVVQFLISAPGNNRIQVQQWANNLTGMLATPSGPLYAGRIGRDILPGRYDYAFVPVFHRFQVRANHFATDWNMDYRTRRPQPSSENRGGQPFFQPAGWYRHALDISRLSPDQTWLGMKNGPGEWIVAYHGTKADNLQAIVQTQINPGTADAYRSDAVRQGAPAYSSPIYVSPDVAVCDLDGYAREVEIDIVDTTGAVKKAGYKVAFMCRIDPTKVTKHNPNSRSGTSLPRNEMAYWRVWDRNAVRPYGLLLKQTK